MLIYRRFVSNTTGIRYDSFSLMGRSLYSLRYQDAAVTNLSPEQHEACRIKERLHEEFSSVYSNTWSYRVASWWRVSLRQLASINCLYLLQLTGEFGRISLVATPYHIPQGGTGKCQPRAAFVVYDQYHTYTHFTQRFLRLKVCALFPPLLASNKFQSGLATFKLFQRHH